MKPRKVDAVVISDVHLGSYVSRANELNEYLKSIETPLLIINGDFLDMWQLKMKFLPPAHIQVIRRVLKMLKDGTQVVYLTGNHDEALRQYGKVTIGSNFTLADEYQMDLPWNKTLIFHGDIFDRTVKGTGRFLGLLGTKAYNLLFKINKSIDGLLEMCGRRPLSLARRLAQKNNQRLAKIINYKNNVIDFARSRGFDTVIVGHSHVPGHDWIQFSGIEGMTYLNCGDWTEHMTSLELINGGWLLHEYDGPKNLTFVRDIDTEDWNQHQDEVAALMNLKGHRR
jgi:UDP-2,3-diacylglucosamine pyrophosphatase LpxH